MILGMQLTHAKQVLYHGVAILFSLNIICCFDVLGHHWGAQILSDSAL